MSELKATLAAITLSNVRDGGYRRGLIHTLLDAADGHDNGEIDGRAFDRTADARNARSTLVRNNILIKLHPDVFRLDPGTARALRAYRVDEVLHLPGTAA